MSSQRKSRQLEKRAPISRWAKGLLFVGLLVKRFIWRTIMKFANWELSGKKLIVKSKNVTIHSLHKKDMQNKAIIWPYSASLRISSNVNGSPLQSRSNAEN